MPTRIGLKIDPLDVLFFRDGRPFDTGMRAVSGLPLPQTIAGTLRTHLWRGLGLDFERFSEAVKQCKGDIPEEAKKLLKPEHAWAADIRVMGPWLYAAEEIRRRDERDKKPVPKGIFVPAPADLLKEGKKGERENLLRLGPRSGGVLGFVAREDGMVPLWHREKGDFDRAGGFLCSEGIERYLGGGQPDGKSLFEDDDLFCWEDRTGIAVDSDANRAEDHMLYSVRLLRLNKGIEFYAEVELPDGAPRDAEKHLDGTMPFGGEGRRVNVSVGATVQWPTPKSGKNGTLAMLVTPGIFGLEDKTPNWKPDREGLPALRSAAVPGHVSVSGWDLARKKPKPTRQAVAAGSVYYFDGDVHTGEEPFVRLCKDQDLDSLGFGLALKGVWGHE